MQKTKRTINEFNKLHKIESGDVIKNVIEIRASEHEDPVIFIGKREW